MNTSEMILRTRQLQITQELHEITTSGQPDFNLIRELLEEYDRLDEYLDWGLS